MKRLENEEIQLKELKEDLKPILEEIRIDIKDKNEEISKEKLIMKDQKLKNEEVAHSLDGLLERLKLAHKIAGSGSPYS